MRAYCDAALAGDDEAAALRVEGVKAAVGDLDDEGHLESALEQVHTAVHLAGDPGTDADEALDALATTLSAAIGAGCRRLVLAGALGVEDPAGDAYLEALAEGERMLEDAPLETVVLRCAVRYGPGDELTRALASADLDGLAASAPHAPLHIDDLAGAVAVADRQRDANPELHLTVELVGPDIVDLATLVDGLREALGAPPSQVRLPEPVGRWLSVPRVGGREAIGRGGTPFADGLRSLEGG